jgi:hypothetical protein
MLLAASGVLLLSAPPALAFEVLDPACRSGNASTAASPACQQNAAQKKAGTNPVVRTIHNAATIIATIAAVAAVIVIIYSGLRFILSGNNPEGQKTARSTLIGALVGLIIIALAWMLVTVITNLLS